MPNANVVLTSNVRDILNRSTPNGKCLHLPLGLERSEYLAVNKVLELLGGKWNRKLKCHVFESDAEELIEQALDDGHIKDVVRDLQQYDTPMPLARRMASMLQTTFEQGDFLLEPSAGIGNLIRAVYENCDEFSTPKPYVTAIELDLDRFKKLQKLKVPAVHNRDFLEASPVSYYEAVIMNPPFQGGRDIKHVMHAFEFLKPHGVLVAVMTTTAFSGRTKAQKEFRGLLAKHSHEITALDADAFKASGVAVRTNIVRIVK